MMARSTGPGCTRSPAHRPVGRESSGLIDRIEPARKASSRSLRNSQCPTRLDALGAHDSDTAWTNEGFEDHLLLSHHPSIPLTMPQLSLP